MPQQYRLASLQDELHDVAASMTGLQDFGDPDYRRGLRALLEAFDTDLDLNQSGWHAAYNIVLQNLIGRLYVQQGWAERPEVLKLPVRRPIVITGLPRTGTTALHRLLMVDPQFQGLEYWLIQTPMSRPARATWESHPAHRATVKALEALYARVPELRKVHYFSVDEPEECTGILTQTFTSVVWSAYSVPTYARWCETESGKQSYRRYADVLRLIGASEPNKQWLLKSPFHLCEMHTLLEIFPDACVIHTHRDPLEAVPSFCSLMYLMEGRAPRPETIGPHQAAYWRAALNKMQSAREKSPHNFFDVDYGRFVADPMKIVEDIYGYFDLKVSPSTEQQMLAWIAANPMRKHGKHEYTPDSWGITPTQIREIFADYCAQHRFV